MFITPMPPMSSVPVARMMRKTFWAANTESKPDRMSIRLMMNTASSSLGRHVQAARQNGPHLALEVLVEAPLRRPGDQHVDVIAAAQVHGAGDGNPDLLVGLGAVAAELGADPLEQADDLEAHAFEVEALADGGAPAEQARARGLADDGDAAREAHVVGRDEAAGRQARAAQRLHVGLDAAHVDGAARRTVAHVQPEQVSRR